MVARLLSCSGLPKAQQVAGHGNPASLLRRAQAGAITLLVSLLILPIATPAVPCTPPRPPRRPTPRVRTRRLKHARRAICTPRRYPRARPLPTRRAQTQGVGCTNSATRSDEAYLQRNRVCAPRRAVPRPPPLPLRPIERGLTASTTPHRSMLGVGDCGGFVRQWQASPSDTKPGATSSTPSIRSAQPCDLIRP
jgi:hypothetical protein